MSSDVINSSRDDSADAEAGMSVVATTVVVAGGIDVCAVETMGGCRTNDSVPVLFTRTVCSTPSSDGGGTLSSTRPNVVAGNRAVLVEVSGE